MSAIARCLGMQRAGWTLRNTGSGDLSRTELHTLTKRAGLFPATSVTQKLDELVATDPLSAHGKAKEYRAAWRAVIAVEKFLEPSAH